MAVEGEGRAPTREQVTALGRRHGLPTRTIAEIIDTVRAAVKDWPRFASDAGVAASRAEIDGRLENVAATFGY